MGDERLKGFIYEGLRKDPKNLVAFEFWGRTKKEWR